MHYNLFLDDERMPKNVTWLELPLVCWTIVRDYDAFVSTIKRDGLPANIAFDHDLGEEHYGAVKSFKKFLEGAAAYEYDKFKTKTGYHCAQWLVEYCIDHNLDLPKCYVHSMSVIGAQNIKALLDSYNRFRSVESPISVMPVSGFLGTPGKQEQHSNSEQSSQIHNPSHSQQ